MAVLGLEFNLKFIAQTKEALKQTKSLDRNLGTLVQTQKVLNKLTSVSIFGENNKASALDLAFLSNSISDINKAYEKYGHSIRVSELLGAKLVNGLKSTHIALNDIGSALGYEEDQIVNTTKSWDMMLLMMAKTNPEMVSSMSKQFSELNETLGKLPAEKAVEFADATAAIYKSIDNTSIDDLQKNLIKLTNELKNASKEADVLQNRLDFKNKLKDSAKGYLNMAVLATGLTAIFQSLLSVVSQQDRVFSQTAKMGLARYTGAIKNNSQAMKGVQQEGYDYMIMAGKVAKQTNASLDDTATAMSALMENRTFIRGGMSDKGMQDVLKTTTLMSQAFGISTGEASEFAKSVMVIGGGSERDFKRAAEALGDVQTNLGLSSQSARVVVQQVGAMIRQFKAFGATSVNIDKVTKEVGNLVASFERVGLEGSDALAIINKMMDPGQIGDSALLWHGLGMSMGDVMAAQMGDTSQLTNMNERMVDLAVKLQKQYGGNSIALSQMAQAYGMNLQQVNALANSQRALGDGMETNMTLEQKAAANRASAAKQWESVFNQFKNTIQVVLIPLLQGVTRLMNFIVANPNVTKWIIGLTVATIALFKGFALFSKLGFLPGMIGKITTSFGTMKDTAIGTGKAVTGLFKKLKAGDFKGIGAGIKSKFSGAAAAPKVARAVDPTAALAKGADPAAGGVSKLGKAFKGFPSATKILAIGAALLAVGVSVMLIVDAFKRLAEVMIGMTAEQMEAFGNVVLKIMIPAMAGLAIVVGLLGIVGTAAASGLLAVSVVIIAMGAAIFLMTLGIGLMFKLMKDFFSMMISSDKSFAEVGKMFFSIASGIALIGAAAMLAGPSTVAALIGISIVLLAVGATAEKFGNAVTNIGNGFELISLNAAGAKNALMDFMSIFKSGEFNKQAIAQMNELAKSMMKFAAISAGITLISKITGEGGKEQKIDKVVTELQTANTHLSKIVAASESTADGMSELTKTIKNRRLQVDYAFN